MNRFVGKVAIVTGGASGIGAAISRRLSREGASVAIADMNGAAASALAAELEALGRRTIAVALDVGDEAAVQALVDRTCSELGPLSVMVNNAGIGERAAPIDALSADEWHRVLRVNLHGAFYGLKHAARVMKSQGSGGVIVNMASILGNVAFMNAPAYTASKHALHGLTKAAALELTPNKIRVVAVDPAFIRTPMIAEIEKAVLPLHPIGRLGEADEVAGLVAYLASDEASFLTGASYLVDGGYTAQ